MSIIESNPVPADAVGQSQEATESKGHPAFSLLEPTGPDFATLPINEAFTWQIFAEYVHDLNQAFLVVFRSELTPGIDETELSRRDDMAREDAENQPGFIGYFKGKRKIGNPSNLSFCMWDSRESARVSADREPHVHAAQLKTIYDQCKIELYDVLIGRSPSEVHIDLIPHKSGNSR